MFGCKGSELMPVRDRNKCQRVTLDFQVENVTLRRCGGRSAGPGQID
jgi:hypothetical protein